MLQFKDKLFTNFILLIDMIHVFNIPYSRNSMQNQLHFKSSSVVRKYPLEIVWHFCTTMTSILNTATLFCTILLLNNSGKWSYRPYVKDSYRKLE